MKCQNATSRLALYVRASHSAGLPHGARRRPRASPRAGSEATEHGASTAPSPTFGGGGTRAGRRPSTERWGGSKSRGRSSRRFSMPAFFWRWRSVTGVSSPLRRLRYRADGLPFSTCIDSGDPPRIMYERAPSLMPWLKSSPSATPPLWISPMKRQNWGAHATSTKLASDPGLYSCGTARHDHTQRGVLLKKREFVATLVALKP